MRIRRPKWAFRLELYLAIKKLAPSLIAFFIKTEMTRMQLKMIKV